MDQGSPPAPAPTPEPRRPLRALARGVGAIVNSRALLVLVGLLGIGGMRVVYEEGLQARREMRHSVDQLTRQAQAAARFQQMIATYYIMRGQEEGLLRVEEPPLATEAAAAAAAVQSAAAEIAPAAGETPSAPPPAETGQGGG